ncbi:(Fe-S)-binding protein [Enterococcus hirae]|nr:(Fe-S)-binding protein [Enterococcus hirae]
MKYGFMAGCSLSSAAPLRVKQTVAFLEEHYPDLVTIQTCCGKPTKYIGKQELYEKRKAHFIQTIADSGVDEMIVACPGCMSILLSDTQVPVVSLWEKMQELGLPETLRGKGKKCGLTFAVQHPCPTKDMPAVARSVDFLLDQLGYSYDDSAAAARKTLCCGMGGMCGVTNPPFTKELAANKVASFSAQAIVTYCASCRAAMQLGGGASWHLLDLIFGPVPQKTSEVPQNALASPLKAWKNRFLLARWLSGRKEEK